MLEREPHPLKISGKYNLPAVESSRSFLLPRVTPCFPAIDITQVFDIKITRLSDSNKTICRIVHSSVRREFLYLRNMWQNLRHFWRISRPLNVCISLMAFGISCFLAQNRELDFLLDPLFWGTALTIGVIAATGYWINDVHDYRIDRINKPHKMVVNAILSVKKVLTVYFLVNIGILLFSFGYLGWAQEKFHITFINFVSVILLFIYASYLKRGKCSWQSGHRIFDSIGTDFGFLSLSSQPQSESGTYLGDHLCF